MSTDLTRRARARRIREILRSEGENVKRATQGFNEARYAATHDLSGYEGFRDDARAVKEDAIDLLPSLIEQLTESVESNGGTVYLADSADDANRYIEQIAADHDAESVVKSKSMTTEELELNEHLAMHDISVYETDLGEFVVQVADESPSHLVGPAIHHSSESIAALFNDTFDLAEPLATPEELTAFARDYLGDRIQEADIGVTGANFLLAESGTLVLVTNEGNARKCAVTPGVHIAVAGVEKIIPSIESLHPFLELLARSATGQHMSRYVTMLSPPVDTPLVSVDATSETPLSAAAGEREFHLVLIDNGRMRMRDDDLLAEALYCIRCSACLNSCANFQHVGGHVFGGETYTGGIGTAWEAGVEELDSAAGFNDLCTGCTRCAPQCPVKIDIPWLNTAIRDRINVAADPPSMEFVYEGLLPDSEPYGLSARSRFFANFDRVARWGSAMAPISNWMANRYLSRWILDRTLGIDRRRSLPRFERTTLHDLASVSTDRATGDSVILFADAYTNYTNTSRGLAALEVLKSAGWDVEVPAVHSTGREPFSQGMLETARRQAQSVFDELAPAVDAGHLIVFIEPSDLAMVRREYERLLPGDSYRALDEVSMTIFELLSQLGDDLTDVVSPAHPGARVFHHGHCQGRTLGTGTATESVLEALGYDVVSSSVECCGMAGSFGFKTEYVDLSLDVGGDLIEQVRSADVELVTASGTSCAQQLDDLGVEGVIHPVELLTPRRR